MGTSRPVASSGAVDVQRYRAGPRAGGDRSVLGAAALVLVAQPWDFQSLHGRGRLIGRIAEARTFGPAGEELRLDIQTQVLHPAAGEVSALRAVALNGDAADLSLRLLRGESAGVRLYATPCCGGGPLLGAMRLQA